MKSLCLVLCVAIPLACPAVPPTTAVNIAKAPKLDGRLDDPCWQKALKFDRFFINGTERPGFPTQAYLLYDRNALYVGFNCPAPPGSGALLVAETRRDGNVYRDDCVEVMIDPNATTDRYFHLIVNANGAIFDRYCDQGGFVGDSKWNGAITARSARRADGWSCEIKIPFYTLDIQPENAEVWGFNFARDCRNPYQEACVAPHGAFHNAANFVKIGGFALDSAKYAWGLSRPSIKTTRAGDKIVAQVTLPVENLAARPQKVKLDFTLSPVATGAAATVTLDQEFAPRTSRAVSLPPLTIAAAGEFRGTVSILDAVTRRVLKRREFPVRIAFTPLTIELRQPHYRHTIFASQKLENVVYTVTGNLPASELAKVTVKTGIKTLTGKILNEKTITLPATVSFPAAPLPEEKMLIFADAGTLGKLEHPLRKAAYKPGEVWRDEAGFWRVEKDRFFILADWSTTPTPGVNVSTAPAAPGVRKLDCTLMYSSFPGRKSYKLPMVTPEDEQHIRAAVRQCAADPSLFAYYLNDEPEVSGIAAGGLTHAAAIVRDEDPYHPILLSNDTVQGLKDFSDAAEINGLHPYPNPAKGVARSGFDRVVAFMEQAAAFNAKRRQPQDILYLQQGFNYGDCGALNSRIPTYDEIRTQYLLTLIAGGKGVLFYNRTVPQYPELYVGIADVARELNALTPVFLADEKPMKITGNPKIRTSVRKVGSEYWLLAAAMTKNREEVAFELPDWDGKPLHVWREGRVITPENGRFRDVFANFDVRIYTTDPQDFGLPPLTAVNAEIAAIHAAQRQAGNQAFQKFEHDKLTLRASSNLWDKRRADNTLWHVTDGVTSGKLSYNNHGDGVLFWHDATPNQTPDWLELEFPAPITASRIVVYPAGNSLRDYEVQAWCDNTWRTLGAVKGAVGEFQELKFAPQTSSRFRILVTANNGAHTKVHEIEIY